MVEKFLLCGLLLLAGCSDQNGPERVPLEGIVSAADIAGDLNGTISLMPALETKGPAANGLIRNGLYEFNSEDGPVAGTHRVLIDVEPPRGKLDSAAEQAAQQWKFEFQITVPSAAPFEADFQLVRQSSKSNSEQ